MTDIDRISATWLAASERAGRRRRGARTARPLRTAVPSTADTAAVLLSLAASAESETDLRRLAAAMTPALAEADLTAALDEAAWRVARLIDLCLADPSRPSAFT